MSIYLFIIIILNFKQENVGQKNNPGIARVCPGLNTPMFPKGF